MYFVYRTIFQKFKYELAVVQHCPIEKLDVKNDVKNYVKNDVKNDVKNHVKNEVKNWDSFLRRF